MILDELMPEFTKRISSQTAPVGDSMKFAVEFMGKPKRVQWFLKDTELFPDSKYQVITYTKVSTVTLIGRSALE